MRKYRTYVGDFFIEHNVLEAGDDPATFLKQVMDDCPECQAGLARGEVPLFASLHPTPKSDVIRNRRPRWRDLKRRARR